MIMNNERVKTTKLDPNERIKTFKEVDLGFSEADAKREASRCLNCPNPRCVLGCPVKIQIPKFIAALKDDDLEGAYEIIAASSTLASICGRVCPQEEQCEKMCVRGLRGEAIAIGALERFLGDWALKKNAFPLKKESDNHIPVAIIGSGPSGLACAQALLSKGYDVTMFEALHAAGGVLRYGIPEFRLPKEIVDKSVDNLVQNGLKLKLNTLIGKTLTLDDLRKKYRAIYIATGAGLPKFMGLENEDANGVFSANEILTRINLMKAYEPNSATPIKRGSTALVIGGGNVAFDAARSMRRLGLEVKIVYRRDEAHLKARHEEIVHAKEEGIDLVFNTLPTKVLTDADYRVTGLEVVKTSIDGDKYQIIPDDYTQIKGDIIIEALGTNPNKIVIDNTEIKTEDDKIVTSKGHTNIACIFAGGDIVTGSATVIKAMGAALEAAEEIDKYLGGKDETQ